MWNQNTCLIVNELLDHVSSEIVVGDMELQLCPSEAPGKIQCRMNKDRKEGCGGRGGETPRAGLYQAHYRHDLMSCSQQHCERVKSHLHFMGRLKPQEVTLLAQSHRVLRPQGTVLRKVASNSVLRSFAMNHHSLSQSNKNFVTCYRHFGLFLCTGKPQQMSL